MALQALFYPDVPFETLYIPYIYKEIWFDGIYVDVFNQQKDMTILDIGANIGVVTEFMRKYAKRIISVEPSPEHFEALAKNKEFNHWDNVEVVNAAIADKDGEMTLHQSANNRTCHSLTFDWPGGDTKVKTIAFDTLFKEKKLKSVDFVKFDVEGAEDLILRSKSFAKVAQKIKAIEVEFHYPNWNELVKFMMEAYGFKARRYDSSAIIVLFFR